MTKDELDNLLDINLELAFKNFDKVSEENCVKTDVDSKRIQELIEAMRNRPVTQADVEAFEERCRKREKEFERMAERTKPDADFYNFQYGIKSK